MQREEFEALVARAIDNLPPEFQRKLENVDVVVED
jgi:predicted Zn-dependent protease with MMP-like domain